MNWRRNAKEMQRSCVRKKKQALQADAAKCVKLTDMFSAVAGPSSAPVADDSGGGVGGRGMHSEEETQEERDRDEAVRVEPAVSRSPLKTLCPLIKLSQTAKNKWWTNC